jgi:hypothetical protein
MVTKKMTVSSSFKSTEIGSLNRGIEQSVSGVFQGTIGSTSRAIGYAKKREMLLLSRATNKKVPA